MKVGRESQVKLQNAAQRSAWGGGGGWGGYLPRASCCLSLSSPPVSPPVSLSLRYLWHFSPTPASSSNLHRGESNIRSCCYQAKHSLSLPQRASSLHPPCQCMHHACNSETGFGLKISVPVNLCTRNICAFGFGTMNFLSCQPPRSFTAANGA